jgi:hypothetical protein
MCEKKQLTCQQRDYSKKGCVIKQRCSLRTDPEEQLRSARAGNKWDLGAPVTTFVPALY